MIINDSYLRAIGDKVSGLYRTVTKIFGTIMQDMWSSLFLLKPTKPLSFARLIIRIETRFDSKRISIKPYPQRKA